MWAPVIKWPSWVWGITQNGYCGENKTVYIRNLIRNPICVLKRTYITPPPPPHSLTEVSFLHLFSLPNWRGRVSNPGIQSKEELSTRCVLFFLGGYTAAFCWWSYLSISKTYLQWFITIKTSYKYCMERKHVSDCLFCKLSSNWESLLVYTVKYNHLKEVISTQPYFRGAFAEIITCGNAEDSFSNASWKCCVIPASLFSVSQMSFVDPTSHVSHSHLRLGA